MISKKYNEQMGNYLAKLVQAQTNICVAEKPISNADRIRSMTDAELAKWMSANATNYACHKFSEIGVIEKYGDNGLVSKLWLDWLKQEAQNEQEP